METVKKQVCLFHGLFVHLSFKSKSLFMLWSLNYHQPPASHTSAQDGICFTMKNHSYCKCLENVTDSISNRLRGRKKETRTFAIGETKKIMGLKLVRLKVVITRNWGCSYPLALIFSHETGKDTICGWDMLRRIASKERILKVIIIKRK